MPEPTVAELVEALKEERPKPPEGETAVFDLGDGRELVVKHWPAASLESHGLWEASIKKDGTYTLPLKIVRVEEGT